MPHQEIIDYALHEFALLREEKEIPGIAFGLMHKGRVVYSSGLGESIVGSGARPTADTVFLYRLYDQKFHSEGDFTVAR